MTPDSYQIRCREIAQALRQMAGNRKLSEQTLRFLAEDYALYLETGLPAPDNIEGGIG